MTTILSVNKLTKQYRKLTAVNELELEITSGGVFGLLGPNGSGKTTTLGMILGVIRPTSGSFSWFGEGSSYRQRRRLGAILEKPNFYPSLTARKNLELVCLIKDVNQSRIDAVLEQVGLVDRQRDEFKTYSLGMKQRLAIASALLADPEILILDEPTNGLDPQGIAEIRRLIISIAKSGKTVVLASHMLDEVQRVCTDFGVLKNGKLVYTGKVDTDFSDENIIEVGATDLQKLQEALSHFNGVKSITTQKDFLEVKLDVAIKAQHLNRHLVENKIEVNRLVTTKKNLEQQFLEILGKESA